MNFIVEHIANMIFISDKSGQVWKAWDDQDFTEKSYNTGEYNSATGKWDLYAVAETDIDAAPTIDPLKHGRWESIDGSLRVSVASKLKFVKDGLTFTNIIEARDAFCGFRYPEGEPICSECPAFFPESCRLIQYYKENGLDPDDCYNFCLKNPCKAAEIMGFQAVNDFEFSVEMRGILIEQFIGGISSFCKCSICGGIVGIGMKQYKFCPYCGAKMCQPPTQQ